jgi:galactokinase
MIETLMVRNNMRESILDVFYDTFGTAEKPLIVRSPGRINLIGEHTDYNEGFVLPAAINKAAYLAIAPRTDKMIHLRASDLDENYQVRVTEVSPSKTISWPNYILGVVAQFQKRGIEVPGFNAVLKSDVPIGAGLSSSAAVECATIYALNEWLRPGLDRITLAKLAQAAEHEFAGVLCGIMDEFASLMGKKNCVMRLDCRSLEYEYLPLDLAGYKIVLLNTNVRHSLASSEYNLRRRECQQAVEWIRQSHPQVITLRDATEAMIDECVVPRDRIIAQRARFVVQEIARLHAATTDLLNKDIIAFGSKMFDTHAGLSKMYAVSCAELNWLVDYVKHQHSVVGARMMGGGFGGCTINIIREEGVAQLLQEITPAYLQATGLSLGHYIVSIEDGTSVI